MTWLTDLLAELPGVPRLAARLFGELRVDEALVPSVLSASELGGVVFVLRAVSVVDALALRHLTTRHGLPAIGFAHELPWLSQAPRGRRGRSGNEPDRLVAALDSEKAGLLFLKRPPSWLSQSGRPESNGDLLLETLLERARQGHEVTLLPLAMFWTMRAERERPSPIDLVFGPTDMPGDARAIAQAILAYQRGALRMGEPLRLSEFLRSQEEEENAYSLVRRLTYALLRRVERERRAVVGPRRRPPERVRDEVLRSPKLTKTIADMAAGSSPKRFELEGRAREMLAELAAAPNPDMLTALEPLAERMVQRVFSAVDVEPLGIERLREAARTGSVVLLPSHKSHVDYLVLTHVLRKNLLELPVVAAGDNLAFFPVGELLRRGGAFFIRRDFRGDRLYAAVVDAYVRRLLRDGWAIEFYLEGGRSRTGRLRAPQLGLLNLLVDAALSQPHRKVFFVPVSVVYDRMMEDVELAREKAGGKKQRESARSLLGVLDALSYDYGRVSLCFGDPIEIGEVRSNSGIEPDAITPAKRRQITSRIASLVVSGIHSKTPLAAGALVAISLLDMPGRGLSHPDLVARCGRLKKIAQRHGAVPNASVVHRDGRIVEAAIRDAARVFVRGGLVRQHLPDDTLGRRLPNNDQPDDPSGDEIIYTVPEEARARLDLVKGQVLHFFADRGLVALAFLGAGARLVPAARVIEDACLLGELLSHELIHLTDCPLETRIRWTMDDMMEFGELGLLGDTVVVGHGHELGDAMVLLTSHASHLIPVVEGLRVATRTIRVLSGEVLDKKKLLARGLSIGRQMFLGGEIDRREATNTPTLASAFEAFVDRGLLTRTRDGYALCEDTSEEKLRALEGYLKTASLRHAASIPRGIS